MPNETLGLFIEEFVIPASIAVFGFVLFYAVRTLVKFRTEQGEMIVRSILPDDIEKIYDQAIRVATELVEKLDLRDELHQWVETALDKGETKLYLAVELAAAQIEAKLLSMGIKINVPEDAIKALIQSHVFNNPDLFPSRKKLQDEIERQG